MAGIKLLNNTINNGQRDVTVDYVINCLLMPDIHQALFDDLWGYSEVAALMYSPLTKVYGIFHEGKPEPIGIVFFTNVIPRRDCNLYAAIFSKEHRKQGKITEVHKKIKIDFFARNYPSSVSAYVIEKNPGSSHFLEKMGFKKIGVKEKSIVVNGKYKNLSIYFLLNKEVQHG